LSIVIPTELIKLVNVECLKEMFPSRDPTQQTEISEIDLVKTSNQ